MVVLEVGMGGAMDSTNVIENPEVCAFTNIGLEHTEYLGNTLEEIATTKGGIIKRGATVVCYDGERVVTDILRKISAEMGDDIDFLLSGIGDMAVDVVVMMMVCHDLVAGCDGGYLSIGFDAAAHAA